MDDSGPPEGVSSVAEWMRRRRRSVTRRLGLMLAIAVLFVGFANVVPASAMAVGYDPWSNYVYTTSNADCEWLQIILQTGPGGEPSISTYASLDWNSGGVACGNKNATAPTGDINVQEELYVWRLQTQTWELCSAGTWYHNIGVAHSVSTGWTWPTPPCDVGGNGWYYLKGYNAFFTGTGSHQGSHTSNWDNAYN